MPDEGTIRTPGFAAARAAWGAAVGSGAGLLLAMYEIGRLAQAPAHRHLRPSLAGAAALALAVDPLALAVAGAILALVLGGRFRRQPHPLKPPSRLVAAALAVVPGVGLAAAALFSSLPPSRPAPGRAGGPNVVLVTVDSLRADAVGALGALPGATPELDRIAAEGTVFDHAIAASSWTLPAVASLLTGRFVPGHGVSSRRPVLSPDVPSVATRLSRCGYATTGVVSSTFTRSAFGFDRGFDVWDEEISPEWVGLLAPRALRKLGLGRFLPPVRDERIAFDGVAAAARLLGEKPVEPFFLWIHLFDPHSEYSPPLPWGAAARAAARPPWDGSVAPLLEASGGRRPGPSSADLERLRALYAAEVAYTDAAIGRLRNALEEAGVWQRTALVVTADHGEAFQERGRLLHTDLFQDVLHVPLLVRYPPLVPAGARVGTVVRSIDVAPTLTGLAGCGTGWTEGEDLREALVPRAAHRVARADQDALPPPSAVRATRRAVVDWPHKLILSEGAGPELYDLQRDPGETRNLATLEAGLVESLSRRLPPPGAPSRDDSSPPWVREEIRARLRSLGYLR